LAGYLDACATSPPSAGVVRVMAEVQQEAWANPSSLHGFGLRAAESLERSRQRLAELLGAHHHELTFCSGATEAIHLALLGVAAAMPPGRLVISAVEHPATAAAAARLGERGWQVVVLPVDRQGVIDLDALRAMLSPPTRLVSLIWGQSEVGTLQPIAEAAALCRAAAIPLHVDAVQVLGHQVIHLAELPIDLLSGTAHKLQGPRGVGLLVRRRELAIRPLIGGPQEGGLRGGTESVVLAAGFVQAMEEASERLAAHAGLDPLADWRDSLLSELLALPGVALSGAPAQPGKRLPHHISLLVSSQAGQPLSGRGLVRELWRHGLAVSSGSACSSVVRAGAQQGSGVLRAMGFGEAEAASGVRISLGPWLRREDLARIPALFDQARRELVAFRGGL
jgi:cysteine desulfurase